jgi:hypothetical protein
VFRNPAGYGVTSLQLMRDRELCILFCYHKCDELTRFHLRSLQKSNPEAVIIPLTDTVPELLPDSVDIGRFPSSFDDGQKWRCVDTTVYRWFEHRTFDARRYLIVEYDCLCTVDLNEYYSKASNADVVGIDYFKREENPRWKWFVEELNTLPAEDIQYASGIVPLTCTMFTHHALDLIVKHICRHDLMSELRLGTIVTKLALRFERLPMQKRSTICWHTYPWQANRPGFFHSIKSLGHNAGKGRQPGVIRSRIYDWLRSRTHDREFFPFFMQGKRSGLRRRFRFA